METFAQKPVNPINLRSLYDQVRFNNREQKKALSFDGAFFAVVKTTYSESSATFERVLPVLLFVKNHLRLCKVHYCFLSAAPTPGL
jgi:hypothetical protein